MDDTGNEYRNLAEVMRQIQCSSGFRKMQEAARIASQSCRLLTPELSESICALTKMQQTLADNHVHKIIEAFGEQSKWHRQLMEQTKAFRQLDLKLQQIASASWVCEFSKIAEQMQAVGMLAHRQALSLRLLEPLRIQTEFVQKTSAAIERVSDQKTQAALEASISVSQCQIERWADTVAPALTVPLDRARPHSIRSAGLLDTMQSELLVSESIVDIDNPNALISATPSTQAAEIAREILRGTNLCNRASSVSAEQDIFKPTTRLLEVYSDLPMIVACDLSSFGDFVDCMYILIYEAAGKDKLRYLKQNGGALDDSECGIVWHIKTLRNKWLRHDADHGDANSIKKSRMQLAQALDALGLGRFPVTSQDYRYLQMKILAEVQRFLAGLLAQC